jgi:hypothetical protein
VLIHLKYCLRIVAELFRSGFDIDPEARVLRSAKMAKVV